MKKIFTFVLAIAAIGMALGACSIKASSPGDAAKQYADYIIDGRYDKFVDAFHFPADTPSAKVKEQKAGFKALLEEKAAESMEEKGGLTSTEVLSETIAEDGQSAYVKMRYTYGNGETSDEGMDLVLVKGRWLVDMNK